MKYFNDVKIHLYSHFSVLLIYMSRNWSSEKRNLTTSILIQSRQSIIILQAISINHHSPNFFKLLNKLRIIYQSMYCSKILMPYYHGIQTSRATYSKFTTNTNYVLCLEKPSKLHFALLCIGR